MGEQRRAWCWAVVSLAVFAAGCHPPDGVRSIEELGPPDGPPQTRNLPPDEVPPPDGLPEPEEEGPLDPTPTETAPGVAAPKGDIYKDKGPAPEDAFIRGLLSFPIRDEPALHDAIREIYDPQGPRFRQYMTAAQWIAAHAPRQRDVDTVADWLRSQAITVERVSTNRLFLHFSGTVGDINKAFGTTIHILERKSPQGGNDPHDVYGVGGGTTITLPKFVLDRIHGLVALDLPTHEGPLRPEGGTVSPPPEGVDWLSARQIAAAYGLDKLYARGYRGSGVRLGISIGAHFRYRDLRALWEAMGVTREDPVVIQTMEAPGTRYREGTLDVQWAGVMAPEAELVVYMGPDARNTSMIYTFNEAIAQGQIDILTDSFCHREDAEPRQVHQAYGHAAAMAAALGITVVAASGDSSGVDTPSSSPYVTAVGGTDLFMNGLTVVSEVTWSNSGSGLSRTFTTPWWQEQLSHDLKGKRAVADVALNGGQNYYYVFLGNWWGNYGTSFSSPVFAGLVATVNQARAAQGRPRVGWLNSHLYTLPAVQQTFRDITHGASEHYPSGPGWDIPTGWGAPDAEGLLNTLP